MVEGLSDNCWSQSSQTPQYPALDRDLQTEVCVVGAGIAGLTTAYKLAVAGQLWFHDWNLGSSRATLTCHIERDYAGPP